jgi:hypothetical protein
MPAMANSHRGVNFALLTCSGKALSSLHRRRRSLVGSFRAGVRSGLTSGSVMQAQRRRRQQAAYDNETAWAPVLPKDLALLSGYSTRTRRAAIRLWGTRSSRCARQSTPRFFNSSPDMNCVILFSSVWI